MFNAVKKKIRRVTSLDQDAIVQGILLGDSISRQIVDKQQYQLYNLGMQADGTPTGEYAPITKAYKLAHGDARGVPGRIDHITGLDTGETYRSMQVEAAPEGVVITADNNGFFDVERDALGLLPESRRELLPEIRTDVVAEIKNAWAK